VAATHTIGRRPGTHIAGTPYFAGGGYQGQTDELDGLVQAAAEALREAFGCDVQIRFNSDRRSGGAWVRDGRPGYSNSVQIKLGAGLKKILPEGMDFWEADKDRGFYDHPAEELYLVAAINNDLLPDLADTPEKQGSLYSKHWSGEVANIGPALAWLQAALDPVKLTTYLGEVRATPEGSGKEL
jgi:hypothetical protein